MAGLLDVMDDPMVAGALGLLSASGPSRMPVSLGQALGAGYGAMQQQKRMQTINEIQAMQMQQMKQAMLDQQKEREFFSDPSRFFQSPAQQALANGQGPTNENAAAIGSYAPQFNARAMYGEMLKSGSPTLAKSAIEALSKQEQAKLKEIKNFSINGRVTPVMIFENGAVKTMQGMDVPPEIVMQNMGDRMVAIDKNRLAGGEQFRMGVSPDAQLSADVSRRGQDMTDARAREANAKPQFADGQWLYPPTKENPTGVSVSVPGFTKPMTEAQSKDSLFGSRAARAHEILTALETGSVTNSGLIKGAAESVPFVGNALGNVVNALPIVGPNEFQQQTGQARRDFVNAVLRKESGAVISPEEFANAEKQYFPQVGDSNAVIEQKRRNRELAIQGIAMGSGSGLTQIDKALQQGRQEGKNIKTPSKQFSLEDGSKVIGTLGNDGNYYVTRNGKKYRIED